MCFVHRSVLSCGRLKLKNLALNALGAHDLSPKRSERQPCELKMLLCPGEADDGDGQEDSKEQV